MEFVYQYRTSDNTVHVGRIASSDRESAFRSLRACGIKPMRLDVAPGLFNSLFGRGKRWLAIAFLFILTSVLLAVLVKDREEFRYASEERAQIFADPSALQKHIADGWQSAMGSAGDAWFARHARPGFVCQCNGCNYPQISATPIPVHKSDSEEVSKMKRMVNRMKREYEAYCAEGGLAQDYQLLCCRRLSIEKTIADNVADEMSRLEKNMKDDNRLEIMKEWEKKNVSLRSLGLQTIPLPEAKE